MVEISQLKENLNDFLANIKNITSEDYDEKTKNSVYLDYKELYAAYLTLTDQQISTNFSTNEIKAINCLSLGLANENHFNDIILQFQKNSEIAVLNVVDFIKSRNGFDLINKDGDFKKFTDDELVEIFGGLFGVHIAKDCIKSLRAEKIGRVVGYALSELFSQDLATFQTLKKQTPTVDFCDFLKERIQSSDFECSYIFNEHGDDLEISCHINEFKNATITQVRGRNRIDHCFVNHKNNTIVFGQSTSDKDTDSQRYSYFKAYITLKHLVSLDKINGKPNPYFGYKLAPFFLLGGRFVIDDEMLTQEKGRDFKKMLPHATKNDLEILGQMQYFSMFGNAVNSQQANSLALFNVFIAGCDTLKIYEFSEKMAVLSSETEKNKLCFEFVTKYLNNVTQTLATNEISFSKRGKTDLTLFLQDINEILTQVFNNFNFKLDQQQYEQSIQPLSQSINQLIEKIKPNAGQFGSKIINALMVNNKRFTNLTTYNENVDTAILSNINTITWKHKEFQELKKSKKTELSIDDLSFVSTIAEHIKTQLGYQGRKFFEKFSDTLNDKIHHGIDSKTANFSASKYHFMQSYGYEVFAQFVDKTAFILDERLTKEKIKEKTTELIDFVNNDLVKQYPKIKKTIKISKSKKYT